MTSGSARLVAINLGFSGCLAMFLSLEEWRKWSAKPGRETLPQDQWFTRGVAKCAWRIARAELGGDSGRDTSLCRRYIPVSRMAGRYLAATLPPSPPPLSTAKDSPLSWLNRQVAVKISKDWSRP